MKPASDSEGHIPEWLRQARHDALKSAEDLASKEGPDRSPAARAEDLLAGLASQREGADEETPAWVARITGKGAAKGTASKEHPFGELDASFDEGDEGQARHGGAGQEHDELSAWFEQASIPDRGVSQSDESEAHTEDSQTSDNASPQKSDDIDDWLKRLDATAAQPASKGVFEPSTQGSIPDWVRELGASAESPPEPEIRAAPGAIPAWLKRGEDANLEAPTGAPEIRAKSDAVDSVVPSIPVEASTPDSNEAEVPSPMPAAEDHRQTARGASAFTADALAGVDVDAIFASMEMPDWLSDLRGGEQAARGQSPSTAQEPESIAPANLPSWVQAMRPVESATPTAEPPAADQRLEEQGPLLGLHGVLPVVAGATTPSSKPRVHSIKLDASPQQQAHAELLEQIVEAETTPIPMKSGSLLGSQRVLRWIISAALLLLLGPTVLSRSQVIALPTAAPNEAIRAIQVVENIPVDAPVLMVFDYEPATMGEMEATAASLVDHLLLLKHPNMAIVSTSPTGSALAERFMSTTVAARAYQRGLQYVDLGYLPGGLAGVYAFAQNPPTVIPYGADGSAAWDTDVLRQVSRLSDFAAIIVLTDGLDAGRIWIEQTTTSRGSSALLIVSSAQTGPMFLPYVDAGQVAGLIAGINGAAGAEQANGGLPGFVRRYWDAYSLGLYTAVLLIVLGGSWYFWMGLQERRAEAV